jgi:hypothetical protein
MIAGMTEAKAIFQSRNGAIDVFDHSSWLNTE